MLFGKQSRLYYLSNILRIITKNSDHVGPNRKPRHQETDAAELAKNEVFENIKFKHNNRLREITETQVVERHH